MTCQRCGQVHVGCTGHRSKNHPTDPGGPCGNQPMTGQHVCHAHGGRSPQAKAAAADRIANEKAARTLRRFGEPMDTTPTEALLDAVKWTAGYVAWLRDKVAGTWEPEHHTDDERNAAEVKALVQYARDSGQIVASVWVDLLGQWHDRLVRICAEAIKAGIEERRVRIAEQQGALVADVIRKILASLDLSPEQAVKAGNVVPLELRRLAG